MTTAQPATTTPGRRRKLKVLIITVPGSDRHAHMEAMFAHPQMQEQFEPPTFSPAVSSRMLNNRVECLRTAHCAGLIPDPEWEALQLASQDPVVQKHSETFFDCLKEIPVIPGRRGSDEDVKLHYSVEFWRKAKTINRGRAVLGCILAHLIALKKFTTEDFDVLLEDNVRTPLMDNGECAQRIWQAMEATQEWEEQQQISQSPSDENNNTKKCHLRFLGWLGSVPNLEWILQRHTHQTAFQRPSTSETIAKSDNNSQSYSIMPFPKTQDILADLKRMEKEQAGNDEADGNGSGEALSASMNAVKIDNGNDDDNNQEEVGNKTSHAHTKPGGTPVWGSYAYWISAQGHQALLRRLQRDVGALFWKGKRMRYYKVKPADKLLPRILMEELGCQDCVQLSTHPAFFRAPMLTSKIHTQWDPEFCKSTQYQLLQAGNLSWNDLWLTEAETKIVQYREDHGKWITLGKLLELQSNGDSGTNAN